MSASAIRSGINVSSTTHWFNDYCGLAGEAKWGRLLGLPDIEQQLVRIPGRPGLEYFPHTARTRELTLDLTVAWATEDLCHENLRLIANLIYSESGSLDLRRDTPINGSVEHAKIRAIYTDGFDPDRIVGRIQRLSLNFQTLDPFWVLVSDGTTRAAM